MASSEKVEFQIKTLVPQVTFQIDCNEEGKAGAIVIVLSNLKVMAQGSKGCGTLAWCTVETLAEKVNVASVYTPNEWSRRSRLWNWMSINLPEGNWLWARDWNMTKYFDDAMGLSARLHGSEERS